MSPLAQRTRPDGEKRKLEVLCIDLPALIMLTVPLLVIFSSYKAKQTINKKKTVITYKDLSLILLVPPFVNNS